MPEQKQKRKKGAARTLKWLLALLAVAVVALVVWVEIVPMVTANAVTVYDSYTVQTGDISTQKSFSASLNVKNEESFYSTGESRVKELYVKSGDEVKNGDPLILLSTGELFSASFDGVVNDIRVAVGDWVWPRFTVVQICDLKHLEVDLNVDEYDIEKLSLGEACTVTVISLGTDFQTVISHIDRVSQATGTVGIYNVTCDLTVPENVLPGMQATVTLPSESVTGVTKLDMAALSFDDADQPYVLLKQADGTFTHQSVTTGLSDGMTVEITSGLTPGETVYVEAGTQSVQPPVTLEGLYKAIAGEKVVINDRSSYGSRQSGMFSQSGSRSNATSSSQANGQSGEGQALSGDSTAQTGGEAAAQAGNEAGAQTGNEATTQTGSEAATQTGDSATAEPGATTAQPESTQSPDDSSTAAGQAATGAASTTAQPLNISGTGASQGTRPSGERPQGFGGRPGGSAPQSGDGTAVVTDTAAATGATATDVPAATVSPTTTE